MIRVHIACDSKPLRDAIAAMLVPDDAIGAVHESGEAEAGAIALYDSRPDVAILAVPLHEDTYRHAMLYRQAAGEETALIGFCTDDEQAEEYELAGIKTIAYQSSETAASLREKVKASYREIREQFDS